MFDELLQVIRAHMEIEDAWHKDMRIHVIGRINPPRETNLRAIKSQVEDQGLLPFFEHRAGKDHIEVLPIRPRREKPKYVLSIALFAATILTTLAVGAVHQLGRLPVRPSDLVSGIPFSFSIMAILTGHELGHYFAARRNGVQSTLPYFLPIPHPLIGTFGAIMRIKSFLPNRRALLQIGMAGPITGFVIALPITLAGLVLSRVQFVGEGAAGFRLGESLLFHLLSRIVHPHVGPGYDIFLHPAAYAGWFGLLVTAMNLMPIGQLDGGHVAFAALGRKRWFLFPALVALLVILAGKSIYQWLVWLLIAFALSTREPIIQDRITPLSWTERLLALIPLAIFVLTLTPVPFS